MFTSVFIALLYSYFISSVSLVSGSATEKIPENVSGQNDWFFSLKNIPTLDWLYDQMYTAESNPKHESELIKSESEKIPKGLNQEEIAKLELDPNQSPDEIKSSKKVKEILEIIKESSKEEQKQYMPFLENLEDAINNNPTRYARAFLRNMWHVVDLGIFNSSERRRNSEQVKSLFEKIKDFILQIYNTIYNFIRGRVTAGMQGAHKGWAAYEREKEGDPREWTEEKATIRLRELENQYKVMNKEELTKDLTSLCMQPLFSLKFYEEIVTFMDLLIKENIVDKTVLDKAFGYVVRYFIQNVIPKDYKGKFAREQHLEQSSVGHDYYEDEAKNMHHGAEKEMHKFETK